MEDSPSAPMDTGFASAAKALHAAKLAEKHERRLARLQKEAKAAERKAQASKRAVELESRKRAKSATTMRSYFTSSRNSMNRTPLRTHNASGVGAGSSSGTLEDTEFGLGASQSLDTEILLSCPDVVHVSDEEEAMGNSEEDLDLSADEMVDSDDEAFVNPPARGGRKRKSAALVKPPRTA